MLKSQIDVLESLIYYGHKTENKCVVFVSCMMHNNKIYKQAAP